jgi:hypothetical protein
MQALLCDIYTSVLAAEVPDDQPFMEVGGSLRQASVSPACKVSTLSPCAQSGLDSLGAVELRDAIASKLSLNLPATVVFNYPTPAALAAHVGALLEQRHTTVTVQQQQQHPAQLDLPEAQGHVGSITVIIASMACRYPGAETSGA